MIAPHAKKITELIGGCEYDLIRAAYKARSAGALAADYVTQHLREAELLAESARVQLDYALLALERNRGTS